MSHITNLVFCHIEDARVFGIVKSDFPLNSMQTFSAKVSIEPFIYTQTYRNRLTVSTLQFTQPILLSRRAIETCMNFNIQQVYSAFIKNRSQLGWRLILLLFSLQLLSTFIHFSSSV